MVDTGKIMILTGIGLPLISIGFTSGSNEAWDVVTNLSRMKVMLDAHTFIPYNVILAVGLVLILWGVGKMWRAEKAKGPAS